jgi:hypothetical protein
MAPAGKPKAKPKPKPKYTDKAQSERFIEAAREREIEETGASFEKAIHTILKFDHSSSSALRGRKRRR